MISHYLNIIKDIKDKILDQVEELGLHLKVDNFHYLEDFQKEDLLMLDLKLLMQL